MVFVHFVYRTPAVGFAMDQCSYDEAICFVW